MDSVSVELGKSKVDDYMTREECKTFFTVIFNFRRSSPQDGLAFRVIVMSLEDSENDKISKKAVINFFTNPSFLKFWRKEAISSKKGSLEKKQSSDKVKSDQIIKISRPPKLD